MIFTLPKIAVLRGMVMNHLIHHRGQLTVYLRLNDVPVPASTGRRRMKGISRPGPAAVTLPATATAAARTSPPEARKPVGAAGGGGP